MSEFIFMLTVDDVTVGDALERYEEVRDLDLHWVGFKDIGLPVDTQRELARRIRADGRKVALEIVSLDQRSEVTSATAAIDIGVDLMMGGVHPDAILPMLEHTNVLYFPFAGRVEGHPSVLVGSVDEIGQSARQLSARRGVHGLDLLGYRFGGDVPRLMSAVVDASLGPVVVAGSIDTRARLLAVRESGAWAFTVGSAVFACAFDAAPTTRAQVRYVLAAMSGRVGAGTQAAASAAATD
jgi:4-hydroxythreonine-4-phosphate dehydrogenase